MSITLLRLSRGWLTGRSAAARLQPTPPGRIVDIRFRRRVMQAAGGRRRPIAAAVKPRRRQHLDMIRWQFVDEARGHGGLPLAEDPPVGRKGDRAELLGPGDAHIGQPALFLEPLDPAFVHRALRGKSPSSQPGRNTAGNSSPLAACSVMIETFSPPSSFSLSMIRLTCSRNPCRFSKSSSALTSSLRFSSRPGASGVLSFCQSRYSRSHPG